MSAAPSTTPLRIGLMLLVCAGLLAVFTIAFVDGPEPSHAHRDLIAVHDSLIPSHTGATPIDGAPRLEGELDASGSGGPFHTWMFRWRGRWASVHRLQGSVDAPPQARVLDLTEPARSTFDVGDLTLVTWEQAGETWVIAGSDDARSLLELSTLVRERGIDALSRPVGSPPAGSSSDVAPGSARSPR